MTQTPLSLLDGIPADFDAAKHGIDPFTIPHCAREQNDYSDNYFKNIAYNLELGWTRGNISNISWALGKMAEAGLTVMVNMGCRLLECRKQINLRNWRIRQLMHEVEELKESVRDLKSDVEYYKNKADDFSR